MLTTANQRQNQPQLDFCVIGGPNCGKSALRTYLRAHSQIFMPELETNFYADDISVAQYDVPRRARDWRAYCKFFAAAADGQLLGEMSGAYLFSAQAIPNILKDNPNARFIVMLRNPVDMARSIHSYLLRTFEEDETSFQKAWELQEARAAGKRIPPRCKEPKLLLYRERCSFASQIERLF